MDNNCHIPDLVQAFSNVKIVGLKNFVLESNVFRIRFLLQTSTNHITIRHFRD